MESKNQFILIITERGISIVKCLFCSI